MASRRANYEGSIYQRKDGRWQASIRLGAKDGKPIRPVVYATTKGEALQKLNRLKLTRSANPNITGVTLMAYLGMWLETALHRETSKDYYGTLVRNHIEPHLSDVSLNELSAARLIDFFAGLRRNNVRPFAMQATYDTLRWALTSAVTAGMLTRNPLEGVPRPTAFARPLTFLTPNQIPVFLTAAKPDRLYAMYVIAVLYGLRQGELFALAEEDFDFNTRTVTIKRAVHLVRGRRYFGHPKSQTAFRTLTLSQFVLEAVREHIDALNQEGDTSADRRYEGLAGVDPGPVTMLFLNRKGGLLSRSAVRQHSFQPILKRAGLPAMKFHALRHTAATLLLSQGHSVIAVARTLGHSRPSMTLDVYGKYLSHEGDLIARRLDAFMADAHGAGS